MLVRSRLVLIWPEKKRDPSFRLLLLLTDAQNVRPLAAIMSAVHDEKNKYILTNIYLKEEEE